MLVQATREQTDSINFKKNGITTVPDRLAKAIENMALLSSVLPCKFGNSDISGLTINCASCGAEISPDSIRGTFEATADESSISLVAYALCYGDCRTVTPVEARFFDSGQALYKTNGGWVEGKWDARPTGRIDMAINVIKRKWQQILPPTICLAVVVGWIILVRR